MGPLEEEEEDHQVLVHESTHLALEHVQRPVHPAGSECQQSAPRLKMHEHQEQKEKGNCAEMA